MKKILFFASLIFFLVFNSSCSNEQTNNNEDLDFSSQVFDENGNDISHKFDLQILTENELNDIINDYKLRANDQASWSSTENSGKIPCLPLYEVTHYSNKTVFKIRPPYDEAWFFAYWFRDENGNINYYSICLVRCVTTNFSIYYPPVYTLGAYPSPVCP